MGIVTSSTVGAILEHCVTSEQITPDCVTAITLGILISPRIESIIRGNNIPHNILPLNSSIILHRNIIWYYIDSEDQMCTSIKLFWKWKRIIDQIMAEGKQTRIACNSQLIISARLKIIIFIVFIVISAIWLITPIVMLFEHLRKKNGVASVFCSEIVDDEAFTRVAYNSGYYVIHGSALKIIDYIP